MAISSRPDNSLSDSSRLVTVELYALFIEAKTRAGRSQNTLNNYGYCIKPFVEEWPKLPLEPESLEQHFADWGDGHADETVVDVCRALAGFYGWLVKRGHIDIRENPFLRIDKPTAKKKTPRFLTIDELRRVMSMTEAPYQRALLLTLIDTGVRIGELVERTKDHIRGDLLLVDGKEGERFVPLSPEVRAYLQALPTHHLFPSRKPGSHAGTSLTPVDVPLTRSGLMQVAQRVIKRAGITGPKHGPHILRHTFGVHFLAQGGDAITLSRILGHSTVAMSMRYAALSMDQVSVKHRLYSPLRGLVSMTPAIPVEELPDVILPAECYPPNLPDDVPVHLWLSQDRGESDVLRYYIRARRVNTIIAVASLETDLPLSAVDGYRLAIHRENQRRLALADSRARRSEILVMCSHCRQVKNDVGEWVDPPDDLPDEISYEDNISHGECPACIRANYPAALADRVLAKLGED